MLLRQMGTSTTTARGLLLLLPCSSGWKHLLVPPCHRDHGERDGRRKDRQTASSSREQPHVPGEHPSRAGCVGADGPLLTCLLGSQTLPSCYVPLITLLCSLMDMGSPLLTVHPRAACAQAHAWDLAAPATSHHHFTDRFSGTHVRWPQHFTKSPAAFAPYTSTILSTQGVHPWVQGVCSAASCVHTRARAVVRSVPVHVLSVCLCAMQQLSLCFPGDYPGARFPQGINAHAAEQLLPAGCPQHGAGRAAAASDTAGVASSCLLPGQHIPVRQTCSYYQIQMLVLPKQMQHLPLPRLSPEPKLAMAGTIPVPMLEPAPCSRTKQGTEPPPSSSAPTGTSRCCTGGCYTGVCCMTRCCTIGCCTAGAAAGGVVQAR